MERDRRAGGVGRRWWYDVQDVNDGALRPEPPGYGYTNAAAAARDKNDAPRMF
jgi:hypothetical protein